MFQFREKLKEMVTVDKYLNYRYWFEIHKKWRVLYLLIHEQYSIGNITLSSYFRLVDLVNNVFKEIKIISFKG